MFQSSLKDGSKQYFPVGTAASNLLQSDSGFKEAVLLAGQDLPIKTGKVVRIDFRADDEPAFLAFGHIKLAAHIYKNPDGGIGVVGIAKDVYNFEPIKYSPDNEHGVLTFIWTGMKRGGTSFINNVAFALQIIGELKPYIYGVQVNTVIYPES